MTQRRTYTAKRCRRPSVASAAVVIVLMLITACSPEERSGFHNLNGKWLYSDTLVYSIADTYRRTVQDEKGRICVPDSDSLHIARGDIDVVVRHTAAYPYSNIYLQVEYSGDDSVHTDTVNMHLADRFGNWLGKGIGMSYQARETVLKGVRVNVNAPIKVKHIMRADTLEAIEQVGIIFSPGEHKQHKKVHKKKKTD